MREKEKKERKKEKKRKGNWDNDGTKRAEHMVNLTVKKREERIFYSLIKIWM